jgi:hemolysin III
VAAPGTTVATTPPKPLLRGVSHEIAAGVALVAWLLLAGSARSPRAALAAHVYGASLFLLFLVSASYHRPNWPPAARLVMRRVDHSAIFLLIAGTYTPFCLMLGGRAGHALLVVVWAGALLGVASSILWVRAPKAITAATCLALGWIVVPVLPAMRAGVGSPGIALLGVGGLLYSVGAVVYALQRPDPFPRVFGYHEVFHALVIAAAACHFVVVMAALRRLA